MVALIESVGLAVALSSCVKKQGASFNGKVAQ